MSEENNASSVDGDSPSEYIPYSSRPETFIVPVLFGIIFIVGVTGNGFLVSILCRFKAMRTVPNTFIFNLAVGDLLVLLFTVPFTSTVYTFESWPFGEFICKASEFFKDTSVGVTVFTLVALSHDRYTAIVHPMQSYTGGSKWRKAVVALVIIWIASLGLAMPAALFTHLYYVTGFPIPENEKEYDANGTLVGPSNYIFIICYPFPEEFGPFYPKIVVLLRAVLHYILPLLIIGMFYINMGRHLLRSVHAIPGQATPGYRSPIRHQSMPSSQAPIQRRSQLDSTHQQQQPNHNRARRKVVKMALSFVLLFTLCFLPTHIFFLWFYFAPNPIETYNVYWHTLKIAGFVLAYANSCVNPVALYCVSTTFRQHFRRLLCCGSTGAPSAASGSLSSGRTTGETLSSGLSQPNERIARISNLPSAGAAGAHRTVEANTTRF